MKWMKYRHWALILFGLPLFATAQPAGHSLQKIWETDSIVAVPESVLPDATHSFLFVSLIDGGPWDVDGKGGVGKLSPDGKQYTPDWITGLNSPKGLGRYNNRLYVADIGNVVVMDIARGRILKKIGIAGATGLNDITVDENGIVYVSDSKAGKVYRIENDVPSLYLDDLPGANGLKATKSGLYILAKKAVLLADASKNLKTITDLPNGGDGVEEAGNGDLLVSEWVGYVYYVYADGRKELLLDTHDKHRNTADIHYDISSHTLYIPEFNGKAVSAWKLTTRPTAVDAEQLVRLVADHILQTTTFRFVDNKTKRSYTTTQNLSPSPDVKAESKFNKWEYVNGVLAVGMIQTAAVLGDSRYSDYARKDYDFIFSNLDYFKKQYDGGATSVEYRPVFRIGSLDDCGSMAAGLLDVYAFDKKPVYRDYLQRVADYILNKQVKFPDGTLARNGPRQMTLWADDLYMSVPFLARMGKLTGDLKYFDFAIRQVEAFNHYIYDSSTGLYFHCFYNDENTNGVARWGRCNGWVALAQCALLDALPADHPKREELRKFLVRQIVGFSRYQDTTGMWHQLLDKPGSYPESSVTAMFVYTVAHAVNKGWINPRYIDIAYNGWRGLSTEVTPDGELRDICVGTGIEEDIRFYYDRPRVTNDTHGLGAFLLAGSELCKKQAGAQ